MEWGQGENKIKYTKKGITHVVIVFLWHKHEKTYWKLFKLSLWGNGALHWIYGKLHIKCEGFIIRKMDEKYVLN
jgi:hypothetical protein